MEYPSFVGGAYKANNPFAANELCINWHPAPLESEGAVTRWHLVPRPGHAVWSAAVSAQLDSTGTPLPIAPGSGWIARPPTRGPEYGWLVNDAASFVKFTNAS